jgi:hypothetical protein
MAKPKSKIPRIAVPPRHMHNGIPVYDGMARSDEDPESTSNIWACLYGRTLLRLGISTVHSFVDSCG